MIFHPIQAEQIVGLREPPKWQHRILVKGDEATLCEDSRIMAVFSKGRMGIRKWALGETIPVQIQRGKKAIGRTPPIREIRRERLGDISEADCLAEGVILLPMALTYGGLSSACPVCGGKFASPELAYACLWNCCGGDWERDKEKPVWVLDWRQ
jgi:hypothetical protein